MTFTQDILNLQEDPVFLINKKNIVTFANESAIQNGFVLPNYKDKSYYEVLRPFELISSIGLLEEGKAIKITYKERTYSLYKKTLKDADVFFMRDITNYELYQKAKREFIANASHELKTPLSVIKSVLDIAMEKENDEAMLKFLKKAKNASESMEELINDMLTLSFVESMEDNIKLEDYVDIKSLIQENLEMFQPYIKNKSITVYTDIEPISIKTNKKLLNIILKNLIDNAIKYNKENGYIKINVKKQNKLTLTIEDSGIGIAKEHLPFIFERFYSVSKDRAYKSTGLGLAIVKHASKLLKINIDVSSTPNVGTTFNLTFLES
ncbi:MAG: sensor histidine kinase [Hydrogenobaculum sp.]|nr:MAG: two-component sensor histidine kinase [Hydrogenobaculum sp.]